MRWGLVGTGPWARSVHAPSLATHDDARLASVWGRNAEASEALAGEYGVHATSTFEELLGEVDAVSLAVAPSAQAEYVGRALARGRHVLVEKPVATDVAVVRRLADELPPGVRAVVFLTRLFDPGRATWLRESIGRGHTHAQVEWVSAALTPGSPYAASAWRRGSGIIWDLMPHVLSQVVPVLGDVVDASVVDWPERRGVRVHLRHRGGAETDVRMTLNAEPEQRAEWIRFDGPAESTLSPSDPLDFVAAHQRAVGAVEAGVRLEGDPLMKVATVEGAIAPTQIMGALEAAVRDGHLMH